MRNLNFTICETVWFNGQLWRIANSMNSVGSILYLLWKTNGKIPSDPEFVVFEEIEDWIPEIYLSKVLPDAFELTYTTRVIK